MPLCSVMLAALIRELERELVGARIDKINQPAPQEVVIQLRTEAGNRKLLFSCNSQSARVCFTQVSRENPPVPPMFCMSLRKHLTNGRITAFYRMEQERAVVMEVNSHDEMGVQAKKTLILEVMGRNSNLILVGGDQRILDAVRKTDGEEGIRRRILPGLFYRNPPKEEKRPLELVTREEMDDWKTGNRIADELMSRLSGICPLIAREVAFRAGGEIDSLLSEENREEVIESVIRLQGKLLAGEGEPWVYRTEEALPRDYSFMPIMQYEGAYAGEKAESFSTLLEDFYSQKDAMAQMNQKTSVIRKTVQRARDRTAKKLGLQREELKKTEGRERLREMADILGAFAFQVPKGAKSIELTDLYDPQQGQVTIPLSEKLSIQQNIRRYYKEYTKQKNAETFLKEQLIRSGEELAYLESVLEELDRVKTNQDIADIREELLENKLLVVQSEKKKKKAPKLSIKPMLFESPRGKAVLVGRNNRENDHLTMHEAERSDLWFHVKNRPGSHVILFTDGQEAGEDELLFCAQLAATYSSASPGSRVEVDYTAVRNVKKPNGARPGMVIYDRYRTLVVDSPKSNQK